MIYLTRAAGSGFNKVVRRPDANPASTTASRKGSRRNGWGRMRVPAMQLRILLSLILAAGILLVGPEIAALRAGRSAVARTVDGANFATWPVSTARRGYRTPVGNYRPQLLARMHYSRLYDYTPMPYSIFFRRGYAIHGTTEIRNLGRPVSHGCVRLSPENARLLFELVQSHGPGNTTIEIVP